MNVVAIVQARCGSTRLPGKVLRTIGDKLMIDWVIDRISKSAEVNTICVATSDRTEDDKLVMHLQKYHNHVMIHRGALEDVLSRFATAAKAAKADIVIRITADCPFVDASIIDELVKLKSKLGVDYVSNIDPPSFPDGFDVEVFDSSALLIADNEATSPYDREHVTPYLRTEKFSSYCLINEINKSHLRFTVDEKNDLLFVNTIANLFKFNTLIGWKEIVQLVEKNPEFSVIKHKIIRNEGSKMSKGQKLWKRAKQIIPGGNMLLSKRSEMFLPDIWPSYFDSAKGCTVMDLDGNSYRDISLMGVGTNILGYGRQEVDEAVSHTVQKGNMSTLNCPEEVWLAEKLIEINPWAANVRFARSGGEVNAIAIRIARAATGKDGVAVCGYHGWHDWYLASNLGFDKNLDNHLLPGLSTAGVPKNLRGSVHPFNFNDFDMLKNIVENHDIGVIKMEVVRNILPQNGFLENVRKRATERGIVLIFDECTSGFRETFGGLYKKFNVVPDIAIYGKAMGNGYAITAVVGSEEVMRYAEDTFISSTFWTERIGPTAALKCLEIMEREKTWEKITVIGGKIKAGWAQLSRNSGLKINIFGLDALAGFSFECKNPEQRKTFITQEMLKKGWLATTAVYASIAHEEHIIDEYLHDLATVFENIARFSPDEDISSFLDGPVCHTTFKRLN